MSGERRLIGEVWSLTSRDVEPNVDLLTPANETHLALSASVHKLGDKCRVPGT